METKLQVEEITKDGVKGSRDGISEFFPADTVVLAVGFLPNRQLTLELQHEVSVVYSVGDCVEPRRIGEAIQEGFRIGQAV